jgi:tripartite-type tricarboxylate transporter receptor subunit TctC
MADEKLQSDLRSMSIDPVGDADPAKSAAYFTREIERWEPIIKATGARLE